MCTKISIKFAMKRHFSFKIANFIDGFVKNAILLHSFDNVERKIFQISDSDKNRTKLTAVLFSPGGSKILNNVFICKVGLKIPFMGFAQEFNFLSISPKNSNIRDNKVHFRAFLTEPMKEIFSDGF